MAGVPAVCGSARQDRGQCAADGALSSRRRGGLAEDDRLLGCDPVNAGGSAVAVATKAWFDTSPEAARCRGGGGCLVRM